MSLTLEEIVRLNQISRDKRRLENKRERVLFSARLAIEKADDDTLDAIMKYLNSLHNQSGKTPK